MANCTLMEFKGTLPKMFQKTLQAEFKGTPPKYFKDTPSTMLSPNPHPTSVVARGSWTAPAHPVFSHGATWRGLFKPTHMQNVPSGEEAEVHTN